MEALDVFSLTRAAFAEAAVRRVGPGAGLSHAIYRRLFSAGIYDPRAAGAGAAAALRWDAAFRAGFLEPREILREPGDTGETLKARLALADGGSVECVLIPPVAAGGAASLCVSTQCGCRMGCAFCETAAMGFGRDLGAGEILGQLMTARFRLGWGFNKVVFMGMGEPLDNFDALAAALAVMGDQGGMAMDICRITVCTVGHAEGIERLAGLGYRRLNLSVSLNAATEEKRRALMPITARFPLARLKAALAAYPSRPSFVLAANYCLMPGINDGPGDADAVAAFLDGIGRAIVNLIPYNPGSKPLCRAPVEEECADFEGALRERGVMVKRRVTRGRSIMAGCGQLAGARGPAGPRS